MEVTQSKTNFFSRQAMISRIVYPLTLALAVASAATPASMPGSMPGSNQASRMSLNVSYFSGLSTLPSRAGKQSLFILCDEQAYEYPLDNPNAAVDPNALVEFCSLKQSAAQNTMMNPSRTTLRSMASLRSNLPRSSTQSVDTTTGQASSTMQASQQGASSIHEYRTQANAAQSVSQVGVNSQGQSQAAAYPTSSLRSQYPSNAGTPSQPSHSGIPSYLSQYKSHVVVPSASYVGGHASHQAASSASNLAQSQVVNPSASNVADLASSIAQTNVLNPSSNQYQSGSIQMNSGLRGSNTQQSTASSSQQSISQQSTTTSMHQSRASTGSFIPPATYAAGLDSNGSDGPSSQGLTINPEQLGSSILSSMRTQAGSSASAGQPPKQAGFRLRVTVHHRNGKNDETVTYVPLKRS